MKNVVLAVATNRPIASATQQSLAALRAVGALHHNVEGSSDVAFARNVMLSLVVHTMRIDATRDVALLVDDDMVFNVDQARELCEVARETGWAASAVYPTAVGEIAASSRLCPFPGRWLTGLGFFAIPRARLLQLAETSPEFAWKEGLSLWEFTNSALHHLGDQLCWIGEDYWLCVRLGGVNLLPIAVGHLKMVPLVVDEETLRKVREGEPLDGKVTPFRVTTGQGSGFTVDQPERETNGQDAVK